MGRRRLSEPLAVALFRASSLGAQPATRFEIAVPANAHAEPITGRVYVMISLTNEREPHLQISFGTSRRALGS